MIQDIFPYRLDHAFRDREPEPENEFFSFCEGGGYRYRRELPSAFPVKGFRFVDYDFLHKLP